MSAPPPAFSDEMIRPALRARLAAAHRKQPGTVFLEELGICQGRVFVDLLAVNGRLHGYEIKSDRDSLRRLAGQVDAYGRVLDQATLVVGEIHLDEALSCIPEWWGVIRVSGSGFTPRLQVVRRALVNPTPDARSLVELLWLDEALALLERRGLDRGLRSKPRRVVWDRICEEVAREDIAQFVRDHLKATSGQRGRGRPS